MATKAKQSPIAKRTPGTTAPVEKRLFQIERLGTVQTWKLDERLYSERLYSDTPNARTAYVGGFEARVNQWNSGATDQGVPERFPKDTASQQAFADGYNDAARQDGAGLHAAALTGSQTRMAKAPR